MNIELWLLRWKVSENGIPVVGNWEVLGANRLIVSRLGHPLYTPFEKGINFVDMPVAYDKDAVKRLLAKR